MTTVKNPVLTRFFSRGTLSRRNAGDDDEARRVSAPLTRGGRGGDGAGSRVEERAILANCAS